MIEEIVKEAIELLQAKFKENLTAQGHVLTGKLRDSVTYEIERTSASVIGRVFIEDYGVYIEYGVPANRIPYSGRGKGRAAKSQYIEGLKIYFRTRGLAESEATRAAFATAEKHRQTGMPTPNSRSFSSTGRRVGFAKEATDEVLPKIVEMFQSGFGNRMTVQFGEVFKSAGGGKIKVA